MGCVRHAAAHAPGHFNNTQHQHGPIGATTISLPMERCPLMRRPRLFQGTYDTFLRKRARACPGGTTSAWAMARHPSIHPPSTISISSRLYKYSGPMAFSAPHAPPLVARICSQGPPIAPRRYSRSTSSGSTSAQTYDQAYLLASHYKRLRSLHPTWRFPGLVVVEIDLDVCTASTATAGLQLNQHRFASSARGSPC